MNNTKSEQMGVKMKKTLFVVAIVAIMLFAFVGSAFAKNAGSAATVGDGYVSWTTALSVASGQAAEAAGPHSNYTVSTVKCAVCHSVHGAPDDSWLLTKVTNAQATGGGAGYVCAYCHGYGATAGAMIVSINQFSAVPNTNTPHSSICYTNCHAGVHGVGVSTYSLPAAKLLTNKADTMIAAAIADPGTGLTIADFTAPVSGFGTSLSGLNQTANAISSVYPKTAMSTGYLCAQPGCHTQSAFAIKVRGDHMAVQSRSGVALTLSGHPVVKAADASFVFPAGSSKFGVTGTAVAFRDVAGCPTCHDLADAQTTLGFAFPHNRYNVALGGTTDQRLWLTKADPAHGTASTNVKDSDVIDSSTGTIIGLSDSYVTVQDGVCLKCHASATAGPGITF